MYLGADLVISTRRRGAGYCKRLLVPLERTTLEL